MAKTPVKYCGTLVKSNVSVYKQVDAFTELPFKGHPPAVCFLEQDEERNHHWLQAVAAEFNIAQTCLITLLTRSMTPLIPVFASDGLLLLLRTWMKEMLLLEYLRNKRDGLVVGQRKVKLCGHATLAAAHTLFSSGLVDTNIIEFVTLSGLLTAKRIPAVNISSTSNLQNGETEDGFYIELDFPADPVTDFNIDETSQVSGALSGASVIDIRRTQVADDILVVVASGVNVTEVKPQLDAIAKCPGRGIIVPAIAPPGSGFYFYSRFFCPKFGINETAGLSKDPACGTAHCSLASYWSKKLGKYDLNAYQASSRGEIFNIHLDEQNQRVLLRGKAVTVMEGLDNPSASCRVSSMAKKPVKYFVVDAFTDSAFKGNPAAVCLLEEEREETWMQSLATEFNLSETCYLTRIADSERSDYSFNGSSTDRFHLRWFTPATEVELCGHATLASAHVLFSCDLVKSNVIEFSTLSGVLTARKVPGINESGASDDGFFVELDFPADTVAEFNCADLSQISAALNGAHIIDVKRTTVQDNLLVELASGKVVVELQPDIGAIAKCPGGGILVTGVAPPDSGFDYYCRTFFPKYGINEDPITGSAQCALAPYWAKKLGKCHLSVYAASHRSGVVHVHFDEQRRRVVMRGNCHGWVCSGLNSYAVVTLHRTRDSEL
ncbi:unnamed protein product [Sphenostylis stenocarpa]|uniref:Uncharacterized protein n=1 Tax=Sphenostylis stenocarpa TaxID=92480 RepID=A0AA86T655_9FABA|nr:unnamed protein product [Sphenostylis stenocarpa]